jgi:hypothetical protein
MVENRCLVGCGFEVEVFTLFFLERLCLLHPVEVVHGLLCSVCLQCVIVPAM